MDHKIEERKDLALAAFRGFDVDGSGTITTKEMERVARFGWLWIWKCNTPLIALKILGNIRVDIQNEMAIASRQLANADVQNQSSMTAPSLQWLQVIEDCDTLDALKDEAIELDFDEFMKLLRSG